MAHGIWLLDQRRSPAGSASRFGIRTGAGHRRLPWPFPRPWLAF